MRGPFAAASQPLVGVGCSLLPGRWRKNAERPQSVLWSGWDIWPGPTSSER